MKVESNDMVDLIKESVKVGKSKIKVTFVPAYNAKEHSTFPDRLKKSLKIKKVSIFDMKDVDDLFNVVALTNSKDVKKMEWI